MLYASWRYALHAGLVKDEVAAEMRSAVERRIVVARALDAFGAPLCVLNTKLSIAAIVLLQLDHAIAPRIRPLYRLWHRIRAGCWRTSRVRPLRAPTSQPEAVRYGDRAIPPPACTGQA